MSYCRIGHDSNIYVIRTSTHFEITITGGLYLKKNTNREALEYLLLVRNAGYKVPQRAIERLAKEILKEELK